MTTDKTSNNIFSNLFHDNAKGTSTDNATSSLTATSTTTKVSTQTNKTEIESDKSAGKKTEMKTVDVTISGATYPINCPVDEIEELEKAVLYINHFIREIRKDAPTLSHENLLVLCCLNIYEEMKQQKNTQASIRQNDKQMRSLIDKITQDAKSILS